MTGARAIGGQTVSVATSVAAHIHSEGVFLADDFCPILARLLVEWAMWIEVDRVADGVGRTLSGIGLRLSVVHQLRLRVVTLRGEVRTMIILPKKSPERIERRILAPLAKKRAVVSCGQKAMGMPFSLTVHM